MGGPNYERHRRRSYWMAGKLRELDRDGKDRSTLLVFIFKDPISAYQAGLHADPRCVDLQQLELIKFPGEPPKPWEIITDLGRAVSRVLMRTVKP
jgi:hypothetical protein